MQCYKTVLSTVYDLKGAWEGDSALWLDSCSLPGTANGEAPEVWIMDKIISRGTTYNNGAAGTTPQALFGDDGANKPGCIQFAVWSDWAPNLAKYSYGVANYLATTNAQN